VADPQMRHLGVEHEVVHPTEGVLRTIRMPWVYDRVRGGDDATAPPTLDEHGEAIRAELRAALARRR